MTQTDDSMKWAKWIGTYTPPLLAIGALIAVVAVPTASGMIFGRQDQDLPDGKIKEALALAIPKVKASEGFRAKPYNDRTGVMTIGYGETRSDVVAKGFISEPEASQLMSERLERDFLKPSLAMLGRETKNKLTVGQIAAIASFSYNTGVEGFKKSAFGQNLIRGDIDGAKAALPHSFVNPGTQVESGLRNRRREELKLFTGSEAS